MTVIADESRVLVVSLDVVGSDAEREGNVFPIWNQVLYESVDRLVRIVMHPLTDRTQIPTTALMRVLQPVQIERIRGGDGEEVSDPRVVFDTPIR